jgi:Na+/H+-dicarboxylate symporter
MWKRPRRRRWSNRSRSVRRFVVAIAASAALASTLGLCASAWAQGTATSNPFTPGLPVAPSQTPTTPTPTIVNPAPTSTSGGGLTGGSVIAIAIGAIVLLGGISLFIWRDARRRAPVRRPAMATPGDGSRAGSKQRTKSRKLSPAERRRRKRGRAR